MLRYLICEVDDMILHSILKWYYIARLLNFQYRSELASLCDLYALYCWAQYTNTEKKLKMEQLMIRIIIQQIGFNKTSSQHLIFAKLKAVFCPNAPTLLL